MLCDRDARAREDIVAAAELQNVGLGFLGAILEAAEGRDRILQGIVEVWSLAGMGVAGGFLRVGYAGDVDIVSGRGELRGVFSIGNFVVVKGEAMLQLLPGFEGEVGDAAMVGMIVDEPVGEDGVGVFFLDDLLKRFVVRVVDDGMAVELVGVGGPSFQNLASLFGFGDAHGSASLHPGSIVHVEQDDFMAQRGEARDGAAAAVFGIAGMSAGNDNFRLARGL